MLPKTILDAPRTLIRSTRLLALMGTLSLVSTGEVDLAILVVFFSFVLFGIQINKFPLLAQFFARAQPFLATLLFGMAIIDFLFLSRSFLLTVAHFLLNIQGLRLLALKTLRDNVGSILLSSMMIMSAATLAVEWTFFVILFLFLPTAIWTIILLNLAYENAETFSKNQFLERSPIWRSSIKALRQSTVMACTVSILVCVIVFVAFPRFNFQGFRGRFLQPVRKTGFTEQVNLDKSGAIYQDGSIVMRVAMDPDDRGKWSGYLRGGTMDKFKDNVWSASVQYPEKVFRNHINEIVLKPHPEGTDSILHQRIYLESMDSTLLFVPPWPSQIKIERPFLFEGSDYSYRRNRSDTWRVHYEVISRLPAYEKPRYRSGMRSPRSDFIRSQHPLAIDMDLADRQKIRQLAVEIIGDTKDEVLAAAQIENYLQENFQYSLNLGQRGSETPLNQFLFKDKKGHCEYFASAMSVMLSELGIPSRMVAGFVANEWNDRGNYYAVRMQDAHAWVEVYFDRHGWVRFDPSPREFITTDVSSGWVKSLSNFMDHLNLQWNRYILSYDMEKQVQLVSDVTSQSKQVSGRLGQMISRFKGFFIFEIGADPALQGESRRTPARIKSGVLFILVVLFIPMMVYGIHLFRRRHSEQIWFYRPFLAYLEKKAGSKSEATTLQEFVVQHQSSVGDSYPDAQFLADRYYAARFSARPTSDSDHRAIQQALNRLK